VVVRNYSGTLRKELQNSKASQLLSNNSWERASLFEASFRRHPELLQLLNSCK
jgi:hypothetical protein